MRTRAGFLLAVSGALVGLAAAPALGADDGDLALVRLSVGFELLSLAFYRRLLTAKLVAADERAAAERAVANEHDHYNVLAPVVGPSVAQDGDLAYAFPRDTFTSRAGAASFAVELETATLGSYLGAAPALQSTELRGLFARIAASEAQHLSFASRLGGGRIVGIAFPNPLDIAQASDALDRYVA